MAYIKRSSSRGNGDDGQVIIIAGLVIAIFIIAIVVVLNSLIFSGNVATRGGDDGSKPLEFKGTTTEEAENALLFTAESTYEKTPSDAENQFENYMNVYKRTSQKLTTSEAISVDVLSTETAWMIRQNVSRNLTDNNSNADWDLTETDVDKLYRYRMNLSSPSLGNTFTVKVLQDPINNTCDVISGTLNSSASCVWRMDVTSSQITVLTKTNVNTISYSGGPINVLAEEVNGSSENLLVSAITSSSGYRVRFESGDIVQGTYDLRINSNADPSGLGPCTSGPSVFCSSSTGHITGTVERSKLFIEYIEQETEFSDTIRVESGG